MAGFSHSTALGLNYRPGLEAPRSRRPNVIFRKVTNRFRRERGVETYAIFQPVVSTARANGASVPKAVHFALSDQHPGDAIAGAGLATAHRGPAKIQS